MPAIAQPPLRTETYNQSPGIMHLARRTAHDRRPLLLSHENIRELRIAQILREWHPVLNRASISAENATSIARKAVANDTGFAREALASGRIDEARFYQAIAAELGIGFISRISAQQIVMAADARLEGLSRSFGIPLTLLTDRHGNTVHVISRKDLDFGPLKKKIEEHPELARRLRIAPPSTLRKALIRRSSGRLLFDAQNAHALRSPDLSAGTVITGRQGILLGILFAAFAGCLAFTPHLTLLIIHLIAAITFLGCMVLRLLALQDARPVQRRHVQLGDPDELPIYSVIVALYREKEVVPQLLVALGMLQWPRSKLEIKIVCEADDAETLAALKAHRLHPCIEIVEVPPSLPRTKPKALAYALPLCSGELVTLYDAEDRPDPFQLAAAYAAFRREGPDLACVQAPLIISNSHSSILATMFAFEYAGLFRGLLPYLARKKVPLPLGGTSNHFRRSVLQEVGGWDPFNVTEDADLGVRFARYGYHVGIIRNPTLEDAPENLREWLPQRIRWFKGWMQTWLVHMRHPILLWRELGTSGFITVQILMFGMIVSSLVHPIFLVSVTYHCAILTTGDAAWMDGIYSLFALIALLAGYATFIVLGWRSHPLPERPSLLKVILLTPVHWTLLSLAGWAALWELYWRPHHWHKTPHRRTATPRSANNSPQQKAAIPATVTNL